LLPNNALCVQISFSSKPLRAVNDYLGNRVRDLQDLCSLMGLKHHADLA
jgi:hypothetical protein